MKAFLIIAALLFSTASLAYTAIENKSLDADGIRSLSIRTYSGPLSIIGTNSENIEVEVVIDFDNGWDDEEALEALEQGLVLELKKRGSRAELNSWVGDYDVDDFSFFTWGLIDLFKSGKSRPFSHLEVRVPRGIDLEINDYRGEVLINRHTGNIELRTGAGPVEISDIIGDLDLQDGSGEISITRINGDLEIRDGGGNIGVEYIEGRLTIHDGGGNIDVHSVGKLLDIRDGGGNIRVTDLQGDGEIYDGGGDIDVRSVKGSLFFTDGGGDIRVSDVDHDVVIHSSGGGELITRNIKGQVIDNSSRQRTGERNTNRSYNYRSREPDIDEDIDIDIDIDADVNRR